MYANLEVGIAPRRGAGSDVWEPLSAYAVEIDGQRATIKLDANDGEGSYSEHAGEHHVNLRTHKLSISADF